MHMRPSPTPWQAQHRCMWHVHTHSRESAKSYKQAFSIEKHIHIVRCRNDEPTSSGGAPGETTRALVQP
jgi:hypothetical protein